MSETEESLNYQVFRDCLSTTVIRADPASAPEPKRRRRAKGSISGKRNGEADRIRSAPIPNPGRDAEELADFVEYLSSEIFDCFPDELKELDHKSWRESDIQSQYSLPLTQDSLSELNLLPSITETLRTYNLISPDPTLDSSLPATTEVFLIPVLSTYINSVTAPPPADYSTRTEECEICDRSWVPLSYHHLIPRFVHEKAVKRGWHSKEDLQNVAWLCGACHRFVHKFRGHEDLARYYYTVDLLLEEEEVQKWATWVSKLRWKGGGVRSRR